MSVKTVVYAMFAQGGFTHQQIADAVREQVPTAQTTARSVASMYVDYKRAGNEVPTTSKPQGRVKELVYAMLAQGGMTHQAIAERVREQVPGAQTTYKSVASMAVDWRRGGGTKVQPMSMADEAYEAYYADGE